MIDDNKKIMIAMVLQNAEHNKNSLRKSAASDNTYIEIKNKDDATKYLSYVIKQALMRIVGSK